MLWGSPGADLRFERMKVCRSSQRGQPLFAQSLGLAQHPTQPSRLPTVGGPGAMSLVSSLSFVFVNVTMCLFLSRQLSGHDKVGT